MRKYAKREGKPSSYLKSSTKNIPPIYELPLFSPQVQDMNWAYFFATGEKAPIRHIVRSFDYFQYNGAVERFKSSKQTEQDRQDAIYDAMFDTAVWSIEANCRQHPWCLSIVNQYLQQEGFLKTKQYGLV